MHNFDLIFVGNGILSFVSALEIKRKHPNLSVCIIGPFSKPFSASYAAGAMQAVFCEVEETFRDLPRDREIFNIGLEARTLWHKLLSDFGFEDVITADSTIMYRRKQDTPFEKLNFEAACSVANEHGCLEEVTKGELEKVFCGQLKSSEVVARKFIGEFAIDPELFFNRAQDHLAKAGVIFVDAKVQKMNRLASGIQITLDKHENLQAARVVVAAGSESARLLPKDFPMVPLYHAVGTAMVLDSAPTSYANLNLVVRTPNRGGAQCGMHIVPRSFGKYYLGAGNYLSDSEPAHRVETIRYLIDLCDTELFGKQVIYGAKAELLLGSRPKSVDGYPIVGTYKDFPEVFVATGTYRIGLTIAPVIATEICNWYTGGEATVNLKNWSPERKLHSYASMEVATRYYSESRISNLIEHGLLLPDQIDTIALKKIELENIAKNLNAEVVNKHNFPVGFVVDPDMYGILAAIGNQ